MLLHGIFDRLRGKNKEAWKEGRIRGTAVLVKPEVLDIDDFNASVLDGLHRILGKKDGVSFHLVSATAPDPNNGRRGKVGKAAHLEKMMVTLKSTAAGESVFRVTFDWDASHGIPGAVVVKNTYESEFLLKTLTLDGVPGKGTVVFVANSWIYPGPDRVFFANDTYLPSKMPALLVQYRQEELNNLRGDSKVGEYKEHDRVYRYDYYNDLGEPDRGKKYARPILGGSQELPYPRRGRTGRPPTDADPKSESRIPLVLVKKALEIYVPRDERFGHLKMSDFLGYSLKAITEAILPIIRTFIDPTPKEFNSFQDIYNLYDGLLKVPHSTALEEIKKKIPFEFVKSILPVAGDDFLNLPLPQVIKSDEFAWRTDEEFAREMLAGVNPVCIRCVTAFNGEEKRYIFLARIDGGEEGPHQTAAGWGRRRRQWEGVVAGSSTTGTSQAPASKLGEVVAEVAGRSSSGQATTISSSALPRRHMPATRGTVPAGRDRRRASSSRRLALHRRAPRRRAEQRRLPCPWSLGLFPGLAHRGWAGHRSESRAWRPGGTDPRERPSSMGAPRSSAGAEAEEGNRDGVGERNAGGGGSREGNPYLTRA